MKYPNLSEIIKYHPYHISTFASFANVTSELMEAVIYGDEELKAAELLLLCHYGEINPQIALYPRMIMMDKTKRRHKMMIAELEEMFQKIHTEDKNGGREAKFFMKYQRANYVNLYLAFYDDRATYGRYLGIKTRLEQTLGFIETEMHKPKLRGL